MLFFMTDIAAIRQVTTSSLSILTAIFPGGPGLAGTRISPFRILLELWITAVVVITRAT